MKEFNLEAALNGEPVILRNGVFGKGIQDIPNAQRDPLYKKAYSSWYNMLQRCYSDKFHKHHPTYSRASVCEDWLVFSNFYYWITSFNDWENLELDKDLLSGTYYSPETCLLLPKNLNTFLTFSQHTNTNMIGVNYYTPKGSKEGVFRATISIKYKGKYSNKHLGHFKTPLEGHLAWLSAKIEQLDAHISKADGKVRLTLLSLKECMKYYLANKKEFYGLECFRNSPSQETMWEEPELTPEQVLKTAYEKDLLVSCDGNPDLLLRVIAQTKGGDFIMRPENTTIQPWIANLTMGWFFVGNDEPEFDTTSINLPKPFKPKMGEPYFCINGGRVDYQHEFWDMNNFDIAAAERGCSKMA